MLATNRPSDSEYRSVRNYLETYKPLHNTEMDYIQHKHDLITLRPGRDHAWLDRSIDRSLHILNKPFPFLTVCITLEIWTCPNEADSCKVYIPLSSASLCLTPSNLLSQHL
jgi:hypothetical protein